MPEADSAAAGTASRPEPPSDRYERRARRKGATLVAGVDEAGRGPLAGPVVAAASIVAKVTRDRLMHNVGLAFPDYGFQNHVGYSTPEHFAALREHGPCPHHRRSFAPVMAQQLELGLIDEAVLAAEKAAAA